MLSVLNVQNLGIVENVEIDFAKGLNIITGETGAGKSLLIDALSIIRGSRFSQQLIGSFSAQSQVTAVFQPGPRHAVFEKMKKCGLLDDGAEVDEVVVRRLSATTGKTKNYINDTPVSLRTLVEVTSELVDISSQFENQRLLDERCHLIYLDSFANLRADKVRYESHFESALADFSRLSDLVSRKRSLLRERELLERELEEISQLQPTEEEFTHLLSAVRTSQKNLDLAQELGGLSERLSEGPAACLSQLRMVQKSLCRISDSSGLSDSLKELVVASERAVLECEELSFQIDAMKASVETSPHELQQNQEKLQRYNELLGKFGRTVADVLEHGREAQARLDELEGLDLRISETLESLQRGLRVSVKQARKMSRVRVSQVKRITQAVQSELKELGMSQAEFHCEILPHKETQLIHYPNLEMITDFFPDGGSEIEDFLLLSRTGFERIRFLIAPNPGGACGPLKDMASGGELSRLMLSIKKVLFEEDTMSVFVFDEIDTGISGSVASMVGKKLAQFCTSRQAIVVTHLPQVACFAAEHFLVSKRNVRGKTQTMIRVAGEEERKAELAQMISGVKLTRQSLAQAQQLLAEAKENRSLNEVSP